MGSDWILLLEPASPFALVLNGSSYLKGIIDINFTIIMFQLIYSQKSITGTSGAPGIIGL